MTNSTEDVIRTICLYQPFASLMLHGKIETRMWKHDFKVRGKFLIYSSVKPYKERDVFELCGVRMAQDIYLQLFSEPTKDLNGYAIALGTLKEYRDMKPEDESKCYVPYAPGRKCLVFEDVKRIKPFVLSKVFRGQGIRILNDAEKSKIIYRG